MGDVICAGNAALADNAISPVGATAIANALRMNRTVTMVALRSEWGPVPLRHINRSHMTRTAVGRQYNR